MQTHNRPDFLIIGAPKAGSTSLWRYLRQHPSVYTPDLKEPDFFCDNGGRYPDWDWYNALFDEADDDQVTGEASVAYSLVERNPDTPGRIARHLPDVRLLYIVRHPFRRIESAWRHHIYKHNPVPRDFGVAVQQFRELIEGTLYMRNLNRYREHFPDDQIQIVFLEELNAHPDDALVRCDRFLGVDPEARPSHSKRAHNTTSGKAVLPAFVERLRNRGLETLVTPLPSTVVDTAKQWLQRPLPDRPSWTPEGYRHAFDTLHEDSKALLAHADKPCDYWDLSQPVPS
jgi:hypothetical protein